MSQDMLDNAATIGKGLRVHTPDPTKYHHPDGRQGGKMRSGEARAVMIPRATRYGGSRGFKAGAATVMVDPGDPESGDGGIAVDASRITPSTSKALVEQAWNENENPEEAIVRAYQLLGMGQGAGGVSIQSTLGPVPEDVRENPVMPGSYVVPKSKPSGAQIVPELPKVPAPPHQQAPQVAVGNTAAPTQSPPPAPAPLPPEPVPQAYPQPAYPPNYPPQPDPWQAIEAINQQMGMLTNAIQNLQTPPPVEPRKAEKDWRHVTEQDVLDEQEAQEDHDGEDKAYFDKDDDGRKSCPDLVPKDHAVKIVKESLEGLKIPGLSVEPAQPEYRVVFDLGMAGQHEAWYHWVVETKRGLFLIYDKRLKYGMKYRPPYLGEGNPITVTLPDHGDKAYQVFSMDFVNPFGVFEIYILPLANSEREPAAGGPPSVISDQEGHPGSFELGAI